MSAPVIGVLAVQGNFQDHAACLRRCSATPRLIRSVADVTEEIAGLVAPGGESTAQTRLLTESGLADVLAAALEAGMPALGTCAGLILFAEDVAGRRGPLACLPVDVDRNSYGRQRHSFVARVDVGDDAVTAPFIRAPRITRVGEGVDIIATLAGEPQGVRRGGVTGLTFHPELSNDLRFHTELVAAARDYAAGRALSA